MDAIFENIGGYIYEKWKKNRENNALYKRGEKRQGAPSKSRYERGKYPFSSC